MRQVEDDVGRADVGDSVLVRVGDDPCGTGRGSGCHGGGTGGGQRSGGSIILHLGRGLDGKQQKVSKRKRKHNGAEIEVVYSLWRADLLCRLLTLSDTLSSLLPFSSCKPARIKQIKFY